MSATPPNQRRARPGRLRRSLLRVTASAAVIGLLWVVWAELHPGEERALRTLVHDRLDDWFPEVMKPPEDGEGLRLRHAADSRRGDTASAPPAAASNPRVLLIHGLDEPGVIWDDFAPAAAAAGFEVWELRYPNDQGLDRSAAYLASQWDRLPDDRGVVLVGHSMGGLVAREFVGRWRHPVGRPPEVGGAPLAGVIMAGTPNQGSEWARLRIWLELREHFEDALHRRFSLFAGLRDGLGEAKIDLRPGSEFLQTLNARPWPEAVPRFIIGARLAEPPAGLSEGLDAAAAEVGSEALRERLHAWFEQLGEHIGDGAVSVASLRLEGAPEPLLVDGSHRTMLRRLFADDPPPAAIDPIIEQLKEWAAVPP
ncbi:MAG: alpha/beta hydrolase [Thiohalocapsa sp.]|nr:alpha/beta hydrolase [Thiohalocapsa sp.]